MRGGFITFEGIEGSGKTTQIGLLSQALHARNIAHVLTREPGGTPAGDRIRSLLLDPATRLAPLAELLLYAAARAEHLERMIRPALQAGRMVLCDRYLDATRAYQGAGRGLPLGWIEAIHQLEPLRLAPDTTLLLDLDATLGLERARGRNARARHDEGRFEAEDLPFHRRVRDGYLALAKAEPDRFRVIDASGEPEVVQRRIQEALCISAA
ncbi:MAG TPA: dTMP kinase [Verrucomicrobiae bacterium]|nr:dTMP kinase [Verrucomicrobiae bacterium]